MTAIRIIVNGSRLETGAGTLDALLREIGRDGARVATAVNGNFAPRSMRGEVVLSEGDRIEILSPMQGG